MDVNTLFNKLAEQKRPEKDVALIKKAYEAAAQAHAGQKRKSGDPFITHPLATATRLAEMHLDSKTVVAALLHDICEDGGYKKEKIKELFDEEVAFLVEGVTKLDKIRYRGSERSAESLRKMFLAIGEDIRIVLLKLVDRLHNMETLQYLPSEKQKRIARETLDIYAPLAYRLGMSRLSAKLEDLSFPYVYPEEHSWLLRTTKEKYETWGKYLDRIKPILASELLKENVKFLNLDARVKHYYSLYRKLLKYDMDLAKITDIAALRIVLTTTEDCYGALGVIHKLWPPVPGKIKDYIALPKPNGYRSLHTTVFGPEKNLVEIQLRTKEMHEEAEHGIAAHWAYAEFKRDRGASYASGKPSFANHKQFAWIKQIKEWQKEIENPDEFLESLKIDFFKDRIFVLTPKGDVVDLPEGATPIDFAYHIHTDVGGMTTGAKVNGKMVPLDHALEVGDVVEILTQKGRKPNQDWLRFAKSAQARKKIIATIKKIQEEKLFEKRRGENAEFKLITRDRIGLLRDVSNVFARNKINLKSVVTDHKTGRLHPGILIHASFKNRKELEQTMVKLKEVRGVKEVRYKLL